MSSCSDSFLLRLRHNRAELIGFICKHLPDVIAIQVIPAERVRWMQQSESGGCSRASKVDAAERVRWMQQSESGGRSRANQVDAAERIRWMQQSESGGCSRANQVDAAERIRWMQQSESGGCSRANQAELLFLTPFPFLFPCLRYASPFSPTPSPLLSPSPLPPFTPSPATPSGALEEVRMPAAGRKDGPLNQSELKDDTKQAREESSCSMHWRCRRSPCTGCGGPSPPPSMPAQPCCSNAPCCPTSSPPPSPS
ncbi:unnamed protein product, partial [Closterium sp. Naga37s-1]